MTLRYLEVFLALARTPNMRDVAHQTFVSQAAVSNALREFETEMGMELFDRVGRGIRLNDKGRFLATRLAPLYNQLRNVLSLLPGDELVGNLLVGASVTIANSIIPQILYNMTVAHPNLELHCQSGNTGEIAQLVESGQLDVGFVEGDVNAPALNTIPIGQEELVVVTADKELAAKTWPIAKLMDALWLLREPGSGTRETFLRRLTPLGLKPARILELVHTDAIKQVLYNPGTLSCMSPRVVQQEVADKKLYRVPIADVCFDRTFYRVEHRECGPSRLRDALSKELEACLAAVE